MTNTIPALWQILLPQAVPHLIPDGIGRCIRDNEMGRQRPQINTSGARPSNPRCAYELTTYGREQQLHPRRKKNALTSKVCTLLWPGPALHSELINCHGSGPLDRRAVRSALKYLMDQGQVHSFLMED